MYEHDANADEQSSPERFRELILDFMKKVDPASKQYSDLNNLQLMYKRLAEQQPRKR